MNMLRNLIQGCAVIGASYIIIGEFSLKYFVLVMLCTVIIVTIEVSPKE